MDGRWKRWTVAGLLAAGAVGCNRQTVRPPDPVTLPPPAQPTPSMFSRVFGGKPDKFVPTPPPPDPVVAKAKAKPGEPLKPETEIALAANWVDQAFMDGKSSVERDALLDQARQTYQRILAADPKNKDVLVGMARMYTRAGDEEKAVATYQVALKHYPKDHDLAHRLAGAQARFGDWAGAAESCRLALSLDPENRTYHKTLGLCQAQLGQWDESAKTLALVMEPAEVKFFLGRVLIDLNYLDQAKAYMAEAVALDPQYVVAQRVLNDLNTGKVNTGNPVVQAGFDPATAGAPQAGHER